MYSPGYFKLGEGVDIWRKEVDLDKYAEYGIIVGHSMGAIVALKLWNIRKNKKLILVNPFLGRRNFSRIIFDWLLYALKEGAYTREKRLSIKYLLKNFRKFFNLAKEDYLKILNEIPKDNISILHGEKDLFLCGKNECDKLRALGFEIKEIAQAGHNWHENFEKEIKKMSS